MLACPVGAPPVCIESPTLYELRRDSLRPSRDAGMAKTGGERGIRTPGTVLPVQRFSKPSLSATQAPLQKCSADQTFPAQERKEIYPGLRSSGFLAGQGGHIAAVALLVLKD